MVDGESKTVVSGIIPPDGVSVSEWCRRTHMQLCHCCDDLSCCDNLARELSKEASEEDTEPVLEQRSYSTLLMFTARELCSNLEKSEFDFLGETTQANLIQLAIYSGSLECSWLPSWVVLAGKSTEETK
jgi:hypothetical protein